MSKVTLALLMEARDLLHSHPTLGRRDEQRRSCRALATRIDAHLARHLEMATHPAIEVARQRWAVTSLLRIDTSDPAVDEQPDGVWVRAWIRISRAALGENEATLRQMRHDIEDLPLPLAEVFLLHRVESLDVASIARRTGLSVGEVSAHLTEALARLAVALGADRSADETAANT